MVILSVFEDGRQVFKTKIFTGVERRKIRRSQDLENHLDKLFGHSILEERFDGELRSGGENGKDHDQKKRTVIPVTKRFY